MKKAGNSFDAETILFSHHLKKTASALIVLAILNSEKNMAVSFRAIVKKAKNLNYATLYGVLRRLEAKGVIYKVFVLTVLLTMRCARQIQKTSNLVCTFILIVLSAKKYIVCRSPIHFQCHFSRGLKHLVLHFVY
jgi:Fe2+ or Zn2+ uptake regulation protein